MKRPLVIGHRGFAGRFAENTLEAVEAALQAGADGVEVDVRPCREGVWVCHHDLRRHGRPLAQWSLSELAHHRVPSLAEVVAAVPPSRYLFVEVKPLAREALVPLLDPLQRLLEPVPHLKVLSSSLRVLSLVRAVLPRAGFSWVTDKVPARIPEGVELSPHHHLVESLLDSKVPLNPWTVNRAQRLRELARLGVASITTDFPDRAREVLGG